MLKFIFLFSFIISKDFNWTVDSTYTLNNLDKKTKITNTSINKQIINYERVNGEINIFIDINGNIVPSIHWHQFVGIGDSYVSYNTNLYKIAYHVMKVSNDFDESLLPFPYEFLLELEHTDSITFFIRPKNSNQIKYLFNTSKFKTHINSNNRLYRNYLKYKKTMGFESSNSLNEDKYYRRYLAIEKGFQKLEHLNDFPKKFIFRPQWISKELINNYNVIGDQNILLLINQWEKFIGCLLTHDSFYFKLDLNNDSYRLHYDDIKTISVGGSKYLGYHLKINNYKVYIGSLKKKQIKKLKYFISILLNFNSMP